MPPQMVVGLGNPGPRYRTTRHNAGFWVIEAAMDRHACVPGKLKLKAQVARQRLDVGEVLWCLPQTFMNAAGESIGPLAAYFRIPPQDVLVVHDELDFPVGQLRLKQGGGHGGHNGLRSLMAHLGPDFNRLRLGIGRPPPPLSGADYVLSTPQAADERQRLEEAVAAAVAVVDDVLQNGMVRATQALHR